MHRTPEDTATMVFDWGSIKWLVSPDSISAASSSLGEVIINPTKGHARHNHPESDEVLYVIDGAGVQTVDDGDPFPVRAGEAIYIPRGVYHSTFNTSWRPLRLLATYTPGGAENALRSMPDFAELPAGSHPAWVPTRP